MEVKVIHQYKNNGYNIVLDVNSGSVHVVDEVVYDVIPLVEELQNNGCEDEEIKGRILADLKDKYAAEDILDAYSQIVELKEAGMLYAPDIYENYIVDFKKRETVVKALCLHIAHDCNLACKYCFAGEEIGRAHV